ncbi:hypothetical protein CAOG_08766 [Capsaspora owczarzaki ATCC 30864]|uniref:Cytochrome c peroxidase, mitochondrial n=1 Tax=Capsaspora owczarzaki (strain ATCC 30864) TaxID=595528 RepID=A0A0D2WPU7_CAPO3|nr:hypothetical protein CAOG_08766 [Capsaspora owczarzaki ATCC 30864]KJE93520.1 hypothetical protein CAOG_008766 [Capsaspora owczarzaki ATCC 30864]|eukprot:XP_011270396.1 hypothetical protein CAOG_08766 [Capsaspora owczarzaki ATCC 30864]
MSARLIRVVATAALPLRTGAVRTASNAAAVVAVQQQRSYSHGQGQGRSSNGKSSKFATGAATAFAAATTTGLMLVVSASEKTSKKGDYAAVRKDIADILDDSNYDDGSYGPAFVRLAWHASGSYSTFDKTGGSNGATMRFSPEAKYGANNGLERARARLEQVKQKHPWITYADLWTLAAVVAIEEMGGPKVPWHGGRVDDADNKRTAPDGRLPDAARGADHVRAIFYRMGFNDQEIVALIGAHVIGRAHDGKSANGSGYSGPWTFNPTTFNNGFYTTLLNTKWTEKKWNGPKQYTDPTGELMMLPADLAFLQDADLRKWVEVYAKDEKKFFEDFSAAFSKLLHLGVPAKTSCWWWPF